MSPSSDRDLSSLYRSSEIAEKWQESQTKKVINHPEFGTISPNQYRAKFKGNPCPFCGQKMVHGQKLYATASKAEAIERGYQYRDEDGSYCINQAGDLYFHPHYITLDHKVNKARCPELLFDFSNLEVMCWKCNRQKGDNNSFEIEQSREFIRALANEALERYKLY